MNNAYLFLHTTQTQTQIVAFHLHVATHSLPFISLHSHTSNQYGSHVLIDTHLLFCSQPSASRLTRSEGVGWPLLLQPLPPSPAPPWAPLPLSSPLSLGRVFSWIDGSRQGGLGAGMFLWHCRAQIPLSTGAQLNHSSLITVKTALAPAPTQHLVRPPFFCFLPHSHPLTLTSKIHICTSFSEHTPSKMDLAH